MPPVLVAVLVATAGLSLLALTPSLSPHLDIVSNILSKSVYDTLLCGKGSVSVGSIFLCISLSLSLSNATTHTHPLGLPYMPPVGLSSSQQKRARDVMAPPPPFLAKQSSFAVFCLFLSLSFIAVYSCFLTYFCSQVLIWS